VSEDIVGETFWTEEYGPYVIVSPVTVATGTILHVDKGTIVRFAGPDARLRVLGTLSVHGSAGERVRFESFDAFGQSIHVFGGSAYFRQVFFSGIDSVMVHDGGSLSFDRSRLVGAVIGVYDSSFQSINSAFVDSRGNAVMVFSETGSSTALIRGSTISGSKSYGLYVGPGSSVDARHSFWGDASGPRHGDLNPQGSGVKIYGDVILSPWLSADPFACCSSVMFLPGIKASRLYMADDGEGVATSSGEGMLWEPYSDGDIDALKLTTGGSSVNSIYAKIGDVLSEAYVSFAGPNIYKSFIADMNGFVATGTAREWIPVAYDWRLSLEQLLAKGTVSLDGDISYLDSTSSPYIIQEFYRLARESKTGRVSIVAHSNGGLVAKALAIYLEGRGDADLIDKMLFVAVPQTGTPHAIGALLHGFGEGIPLLASAKSMRRLGQNMPGAYNLLPSAWYVAFDSRPIISFSATTSSSSLRELYSAYGLSPTTFSSLLDFLVGAEGRKSPAYADLSLPETLNRKLLDKAVSAHEALDAWTPSPSSEVFQVAGRGIDTVSSIEYFEGRKGKKPVLLYKPAFRSDGDGTVVTESAWALRDTDNVSKFWVDLKLAGRGLSRNRSHADILEVDGLRNFILEVLSEDPHDIRHRAEVPSAATLLQKDMQKKTRIIVYSPDVLVHAWDSQGNHTGISSSTGLIETNVPGSDYLEFGDVVSVVLPSTGSQVTISGSSTSTSTPADDGSISIDIDEVLGDEVATSSSYGDVTLPGGAVIIVDVLSTSTPQGSTTTVPVVSIDEDGDGVVDHELMPDIPGEPVVSEEDADGDDEEDSSVALGVPEIIESSKSGGRRRAGQASSSLSGPSGTTPVLDPFVNEVVSIDALSATPPHEGVPDTYLDASSSIMAHAVDTSQIQAIEQPQNMAASYIALSQTGGYPRPGLFITIILIGIALLLALAILWFLSCKISKSR